MANKHIKKQNSVSFVTRKIEVKPDTTTHTSECLKLKRTDHVKCQQDCRTTRTLRHCWWDIKW